MGAQGSISPGVVPDRYQQLVMALFSDWEEFKKSLGREQRSFVVVNTSGWIQGLGQDLLTHLCQKQSCTKGHPSFPCAVASLMHGLVFLLTDQDDDAFTGAMSGLHYLPSFQIFGKDLTGGGSLLRVRL